MIIGLKFIELLKTGNKLTFQNC